jgi:hypothetical protein
MLTSKTTLNSYIPPQQLEFKENFFLHEQLLKNGSICPWHEEGRWKAQHETQILLAYYNSTVE